MISRVKKTKKLSTSIILLALANASAMALFHDRFFVVFPQVARGVLGRHIETVIVITNPQADQVQVTLRSGDSKRQPLFPTTHLFVGSGETTTFRIRGDDFKVGWVRLESPKTVSAVAHIISRPSATSVERITQVTVLPQPPTSKAVVPVFRSVPNSGEMPIENTGIAIVGLQPGTLSLTLRDNASTVVASKALRISFNLLSDGVNHFAQFITELFPEMPASFVAGSLTIEFTSPEIARTFAVTALYTKGDEIWSAAVTSVDIPATFFVKLKPAENFQQQVNELSRQYGFTVASFFSGDPRLLLAKMTEEVARAVARDPRVEFVEPNQTGEAASLK